MKKILKYLFLVLLLFILAFVCFYLWASSPNYGADDYVKLYSNTEYDEGQIDSVYSILTYNIGYLSGMTNNQAVVAERNLYDNNLKKVNRNVTAIDPDIICLQEIDYHSHRSFYVNQDEELQKLGYKYSYSAANWDEHYLPFPGTAPSTHYKEIFSGQSIISKFAISDPQRIVLDRVESNPFYRDAFYLDRLAQVCKVKIDNKEVVIINVHLEAFDQVTRTNQTKTVKEIYEKYDDDYPTFLVGDFNSDNDYDNASITILQGIEGVESAVPTYHTDKTYPADSPVERLDYIFYNGKFIEHLESNVVNSFDVASDHLPVFMTFKFK